ncbi:MAG: ATP-binding protein [Verrucomicrobiales bacterium]|nr:ATP-binding protein [Verrucomicrobiales bacterium]
MKKLNFEIEVTRVLEILSNDIYDSPYALLRENIQNAYDAILMRQSQHGSGSFVPTIDVKIDEGIIIISDNGVGMNEVVLQNNFWKAGSSGKNTDIARRAGVVGTFGIGAMANFGIANSLTVVSRSIDGEQTIRTSARRESLSVTKECVEFEVLSDCRTEPGTTIEAHIDAGVGFDLDAAIDYLNPFVRFLEIPVVVNGKLISKEDYVENFAKNAEPPLAHDTLSVRENEFSCDVEFKLAKNGTVRLMASNINHNGGVVSGNIVLEQNAGSIFGLRNRFGLAPFPAPNSFNFGGVVNLNNLQPTAGRDSIGRDSINFVTRLLATIEGAVCERLAEFEAIDNNPHFLTFIVNRSRYDLSKKIRIDLKPGQESILLEAVEKIRDGKPVYFYGGRDQTTILAFGNENSFLLHLSQGNPRRKIQLSAIRKMGVEEVPDRPQIISLTDRKDLSTAEVATAIRISAVLAEDYLIGENEVQFADISHQVPSLVEKDGEVVRLYISRNSGAVAQVVETYNTAYEVFGGFVKDFIRSHLFPKFSEFVPSSTRAGAEALQKILQKNRELFKYEQDDLGDLDSLFGEYVSGELEFSEVLKRSTEIQRSHAQRVDEGQVGSAEEEIPSLSHSSGEIDPIVDIFAPMPPIDRTDSNTEKKILKTAERYPHLNSFCLFLCLSERVYRRHRDFFLEPHTTKVIWGMHRIVYIFTHASSNISLYYDIELKERLTDDSTGGSAVPTTTILTNEKIFIPVLNELEEYFDIKEGSKEFFVRHDLITDFGGRNSEV